MSGSAVCAPKVVLLGESGVGKTALASRLVDDAFNLDQPATVGADFRRKTLTVNSQRADLAIWDTAGQEVYRALTPQYYRDAQMALVVFSLIDDRSFKEASYWIDNVRAETPSAVIALAGNKADLNDQRVITVDQAIDLAAEYKIPFVETSANTGQGVSTVFESMLEAYLEKVNESIIQPPAPQESGGQPLDLTVQPAPAGKKCC
jgi:small GTP-binding protein